jgi:3-oxoacyl-[acyl-carrier-protein] synthase II
MRKRAVWVTGMGAVSAAGVGRGALLEMIRAERSGIVAGSERGGTPAGRVTLAPQERDGRRLDRSATLFLAAADEAWISAGLSGASMDPVRCAVIEGSSLGPLADLLTGHKQWLAENEAALPPPSGLLKFLTGAGGASFAHTHGIRGPVLHVAAGCVAGATAIGEGFVKIATGAIDVAVVGGAECPLHEYVIAHFKAGGILAHPGPGDPLCCPFDARRTGTVLGEGAGVLVLEAADHAHRRGVPAHAEVTGFGFACGAYSMITPDPDGGDVAAAACQALEGVPLAEVGWIKAHGTGTASNDAAECRGLAAVFGDRLAHAPLTSLKPMLGHCLGASGAVEAVAALLAFAAGVVPATVGTEAADPTLPPCRVATRIEAATGNRILLLAEGFGGRCAALALRRV